MNHPELSLEAFAARRRNLQDDYYDSLRARVRSALANDSWNAVLATLVGLYSEAYADDGPDVADARPSEYIQQVSKELSEVQDRSEEAGDRITRWLSTSVIAAASAQAADDDGDYELEWVHMEDDHVRPTHELAGGQRRRPGEKFKVGESELRFPGDPLGPMDETANCRCTLRPVQAARSIAAAATADGDAPPSATVVVALPHPDDTVHRYGPEQKHATILYLGENFADPEGLNAFVASQANRVAPFHALVDGLEVFGQDEEAHVLRLSSDDLSALRGDLLDGGFENASEFTDFKPHVTLGYGDEVPEDDRNDALAEVHQINFDRLAVWHGEEQNEYPLGGAMTASTEEPQVEPVENEDEAIPGPLPWHGVWTVEGIRSGDGRKFAEGALRSRPLPLPMSWQKVSGPGHDGSVVTAKTTRLARVGNEIRAAGTVLQTPEADEMVGLMSEFPKFGVSIDADDVGDMAFDEETEEVTFNDARICSASALPIPAFAEAYVSLGEHPEGFFDGAEDLGVSGDPVAFAISEKPWSGSASRFTPEQWKASCILHVCDGEEKSCHELPIREPGGSLSRAGVHAAAARFNQVDAPPEAKSRAKASLRGAYKELGEEPPEAIAAAEEYVIAASGSTLTFKRGPGWITNPEDTRRLWNYWVHGEGAAKINWGVPGDFNRCRVLVGEKIGENSPEDLRFLNQICAQWHHDAKGIWPGQEAGLTWSAELPNHPPSLTNLVSAGGWCAPSAWFTDPEFTDGDERMVKADGTWGCPMTITDDGQVYGHIAKWGTCHTGFPNTCVTAPRSEKAYAYFLLGETLTAGGGIPTGVISLGGGHADTRLGMRAAMAHYDETSTAVADIACGEDAYGIWFAGALRPSVTDEQIAELRAAKLSGDWRKVGNSLEMIAALAVNVPGFPVPRVAVAAGIQTSLVAAGVVADEPANQGLDYRRLASAILDEEESRVSLSLKSETLAREFNKDRQAALAAAFEGE